MNIGYQENQGQARARQKTRFTIVRLDFLAIIVIFLFLVSGIATLHLYGISWDEGLGNMFFGERYLAYFKYRQPNVLDFNKEFPYHTEHPLNLFQSTWRTMPEAFPALGDIASAASMYTFSYWLKLMDPVDAYHTFNILMVTFFLLVLYFFNARRLGRWPALIAVIILAVTPRFWGDMHFNTKDVVETCLYGLTIMAYVAWYERPHFLRASLFALSFGCAMAVKANAVFIPFLLILGAWPWLGSPRQWLVNLKHVQQNFYHYLWMLNLSAVVYFLSWPYLYENPLRVLNYFKFDPGEYGKPEWSLWPIKMVFSTMPEIIILALLVGVGFLIWGFIKPKQTTGNQYKWLLMVWVMVPILRSSTPYFLNTNFNGIRHFLEFLPAAALIAGYGVYSLVRTLGQRHKQWALVSALVLMAAFLVNLTYIYKVFHPFEYIYFNSLVGGQPGGGKEFGPGEATDYWAVSYRQGMEWINANAPQDSTLVVPIANWLVNISAPIWLRPDIKIIPEDQIKATMGKHTIYVMTITSPIWYKALNYYCIEKLDPVYSIEIQSFPIMVIYNYK